MSGITERYANRIVGTLSCFDRILITGILCPLNFREGLSSFLYTHGIRYIDYMVKFAQPLRDKICDNAEKIAKQNGLVIEYITSKKAFRKEERIKEILQKRGSHPGLVHIFTATESCPCFEPKVNKSTGKTGLVYRDAKCKHYYFYFIHETLGLCYLRVPTWVPFRIQFYCNGHNFVAGKLSEQGIEFTQVDNAFVYIAHFDKAQAIADKFSAEMLQPVLDRYANMYCPITGELGTDYWWTLTQLEYSTDIVFRKQEDLAPIYESLTRAAVLAVKADNIATFLSHRITYNCQQEVGSDFHTRVEGTRIKHQMGSAAIKMYDKYTQMLRIETVVNDVSFFTTRRPVQHRDGTTEVTLAPVKKTIYSLGLMRGLMASANRRYLEFISELSEPSAGVGNVHKLSDPVRAQGRSYRGFNPFDAKDSRILRALLRGEFNISGFTNSALRRILTEKTSRQISSILRRLRLHGIIKKVSRRHKYYLSKFGRTVVLTAFKVKELVVIPSLAGLKPA
jgi:hypothetical protein